MTKQTLKALANFVALLAVLPALAGYAAGALVLGRQRAFAGWSQAMALLPGITGVYLRRAFYRATLARCGRDAWVSFGTIISHPTTRINDSVYIGAYCVLGDVTLESDVLLGSHVSLINGGHQHGIARLDVPIRRQPGSLARVTIGRGSWIGERSVVQANVGRDAVIGAGSVVAKPLPDCAIAIGVPARVLRYRTESPAAQRPTSPTAAAPSTLRETN